MLELCKEDKKQLVIKKIAQEEVNQKLQKISKDLESIPNIGFNYIEYISALIYAMYENRQDWDNLLKINPEYMLEEMDHTLYAIREKEGSKKLFINIKFAQTIEKENYLFFGNIINELILLLEETEKNSKSMLAEAFEYIIMRAAQNKDMSLKNGEFYTPKGLVKTMVNLLDIKDNMTIYNPACGTGNFITESAKYANIYALGEETNISNYNICTTNLWMHDISKKRIKETSEEKFELADIAIANPPFTADNKEEIITTGTQEEIYYQYGILPTTSTYIKHLVTMLESISEKGKMAIILPHGFLFKKTRTEYEVRRRLIEQRYIDAIISLPEKLFYNTKMPVVILLIDKAKQRDEVLFIDASREYTSKRKTNILAKENQKKIVDTYRKYEGIANYSYIASLEEIRKNNYDLNIRKYVQIQNKIENINQEEIEKKIYELEKERYEIQKQMADLITDTKIR